MPQFSKHWTGIFRPKDNAINNSGVEIVPADLGGEQRIAHIDKTFGKAIQKPIAVKFGDVGSPACADYHPYWPFQGERFQYKAEYLFLIISPESIIFC